MRWKCVCLAFLVMLPLAGCKGIPGVADNAGQTMKRVIEGKSDLLVFQILMGTELNERDEIVKSTAVFSPDERDFHVHAFFSNLTESAEVVGSWWILPEPPEGEELVVEVESGVNVAGAETDVMRGQMIYEIPVMVAPELPVAKFHLRNTESWPVGTYHFVITEKNKLVTEIEFSVSEDAAKLRRSGL